MAKPLICARVLEPLSDVMHEIPISESMNSSGEPNVSTRGRTMGIASARATAPINAPIKELISAAPRARPASPLLAIG